MSLSSGVTAKADSRAPQAIGQQRTHPTLPRPQDGRKGVAEQSLTASDREELPGPLETKQRCRDTQTQTRPSPRAAARDLVMPTSHRRGQVMPRVSPVKAGNGSGSGEQTAPAEGRRAVHGA